MVLLYTSLLPYLGTVNMILRCTTTALVLSHTQVMKSLSSSMKKEKRKKERKMFYLTMLPVADMVH
jgi:uncharacterized protein YhhL (DUF1145 family)